MRTRRKPSFCFPAHAEPGIVLEIYGRTFASYSSMPKWAKDGREFFIYCAAANDIRSVCSARIGLCWPSPEVFKAEFLSPVAMAWATRKAEEFIKQRLENTLANQPNGGVVHIFKKKGIAGRWIEIAAKHSLQIFQQLIPNRVHLIVVPGVIELEQQLNNGLFWEEAEASYARAGLHDKDIYRVTRVTKEN